MEAVVFCGIQCSGKSTFYRERFADSHVRINLDMLRTRGRESILLRACIEAKQPFVVDNTNTTIESRRRYIVPARIAGFRLVAYYFHADVADAIARNRLRPQRQQIRPGAIVGTYRRLQPPSKQEGYAVMHVVGIDGHEGFSATEIDDLAGALGRLSPSGRRFHATFDASAPVSDVSPQTSERTTSPGPVGPMPRLSPLARAPRRGPGAR